MAKRFYLIYCVENMYNQNNDQIEIDVFILHVCRKNNEQSNREKKYMKETRISIFFDSLRKHMSIVIDEKRKKIIFISTCSFNVYDEICVISKM